MNTFYSQTNQVLEDVKIDAIKTQIVDSFCIGLIGSQRFSTNNTSLDDELVYFPWTTSNRTSIAVPAELEYAYQVELHDTNGVVMPKTDIGKTVGVKFFNFDASGPQRGIAVNHLRAEKVGKMTSAPFLFYPFRASDLFQVKKPGNYTLQIRFQILAFPRTGPNRGDYTNDLIRFPPINYPLVQPPSTTNAPAKAP